MSPQVAFCALNSRYSHTAAASRGIIRYLRQVWPEAPAPVLIEETIHEPPLQILRRLVESQAPIFAFSCYIWNIELVAVLCRQLRRLLPRAVIIWGGPEAGSQAESWLEREAAVDYIIRGEGEIAFCSLIQALRFPEGNLEHRISSPELVPSLVWRDPASGRPKANPPARPLDGGEWAFPYTSGDLEANQDKIIYYEASRGCPYACSYCLSVLEKNVRSRPLELVRRELAMLIKADVRQVKFVDRTFNYQPRRAMLIWQHLLETYSQEKFRTNFHFEISGDLLTDEAVHLLRQAPAGLFQFEIGVQTVQPHVLEAINRRCDLDKLRTAVADLRENSRVHLHLDLIAGLPGETLPQFMDSLEWVFALRPHQLQLGFLKVLPGTPMLGEAGKRGFIWQDSPPYEILASDTISFPEMCRLKDIALLLEQYWNSSLLPRALPWLIRRGDGAAGFCQRFAAWLRENGHFQRPLNPGDRARLVWEFGRLSDPALREGWQEQAWLDLVRLDYYDSGQKDQPRWLGYWEHQAKGSEVKEIKQLRRQFKDNYPEVAHCRIEKFSFDLKLFLERGEMRPGECFAGRDLAGSGTCAWRVIMSN